MHPERHNGREVQVQNFSPIDSDERIVEFRTRDDRGAIVEILEVFQYEGSDELFIRLIDQPVSVRLVQWAVQEATRRLS
jgi:imidazole glycerol phosphate synthase subunit HisF